MSEISAKIAFLKRRAGGKTSRLLPIAKVSRETFRKIERGETVKLPTLKQVADALGATDEEWLELVVAWLKTEASDSARHLHIGIKEKQGSEMNDAANDETARLLQAFKQLNHEQRQEVLKALHRPEVLLSLAAINRVWERMDRQRNHHAPA